MKKILLVTRNFPPLTGGMERLNQHIYLELNKYFEVSISGPIGCHEYLDSKTAYSESPHKPIGYFLWHSFWKTLRLAISLKPDAIIAGSGTSAFSARVIGYIVGAKVITFLHGLDIVSKHPIYQRIFLPTIRLSDGIWVNSNNTKNLAIDHKIPPGKIKVIHPGVSIPKAEDINSSLQNLFRSDFGISNEKFILLSVGRLTERKGLLEFIKYSLPDIVNTYPEVIVLVIGDDPKNALHHKSGIKRKIQDTIEGLSLKKHVIFLGHVSEQQLAAAYLTSDIHIFPVIEKKDDIEGFGMVAIEAAAYGLPTIAFSVGGIPDAVTQNVSGLLVEPENYQQFTNSIINFIESKKENKIDYKNISSESCRKHATNFSWEIFGKKLKSNLYEY